MKPNLIFSSGRHLSKAAIQKKKDALYANSFRDLPENTIYYDPLGKLARQPVNMKKDMYKKELPILRQFDDLQRQGFSVGDSIAQIRKSIGTGSWNLPVYYVPEVAVSNPEQTPMSDLMPRVAIRENSVNVTEETAEPNASVGWDIETALGTFNGTYDYATGTYSDHSYDVVGYGLGTAHSDQLMLAERGLRSTSKTSANMLANAIRQAEERQILYGTGYDANGFNGLEDIQSTEQATMAYTACGVEEIRDLVDDTEYEGANLNDLVVVTNFDVHKQLREELVDYTWYKPATDMGLDFGFRYLEIESVPVLKSHGVTAGASLTTGDPFAFCVDFSTTYMAMLQERTIQPLARLGPQERIAMDCYGTLVAENPEHIQYIVSS